MTKKMIRAVARDDVKYSLSGKLSEALEEIQKLIEEHGADATLDIDKECEAYSDYEYAYARVYIMREETDEEYAKRVAQEKKYAEQREQQDREAYERLKKKFGS